MNYLHQLCRIPILLFAAMLVGCVSTNKHVLKTAPATRGGDVVFRSSVATDEDPFAAGQVAAEALKKSLNGVEPHAIVLSECFEELAQKKKVISGVASVFSKDIIFGVASYGVYAQTGAYDTDAVALLGIGGSGISVAAALSEKMGASTLSLETQEAELIAALNEGGAAVARQLPNLEKGTMMLLWGDAHSPKNLYLIDGVQHVAGKNLPITGGSANKNKGQTYIYYRGNAYTDSACGLLLTGSFRVGQTGLQAKSNDKVIETAKIGSATAQQKIKGTPFVVVAYDCAGRMGKLDRLEDELMAIQSSVGKAVPLFGSFGAGEFGPADNADASDETCTGRGWHVMFSVLGE